MIKLFKFVELKNSFLIDDDELEDAPLSVYSKYSKATLALSASDFVPLVCQISQHDLTTGRVDL